MRVAGIDQAIWLAGFACEILLFAILLARRQYRHFPIFVAWIGVLIITDPVMFWATGHLSEGTYYRAFAISSGVSYLLQLALLAEVAHAVLRPGVRETRVLLASTLALSAGLLLPVILWAFNPSWHGQASQIFDRIMIVVLSFAFLRILLFALIAGFSQMLGITWRNHVIRLAAGLAFYGVVAVISQLTISHLSYSNAPLYNVLYHLLDRMQVTALIASLAFWVYSFVQKEAPRREFTPQMQRFLVTISENARQTRLGLTRSRGA